MTRLPFIARYAAVLVVIAAFWVLPTAAQSFKWWHNSNFRRELSLSQEQVDRLEEIFQSSTPTLRNQKRTLDQAEGALELLVEAGDDDAAVMQQVEVVEAKRAELSKSRTMMLLRMRRVLTADQRTKLAALHEARERERQRPQGRGR
jgi:Spy/CpxP family protein refolding chaperone